MKAIILAAGLGTRMKPLTNKLPKPMVKVLDKNLLEYKLESLPESITEIILVVGYKGNIIKKYFGNNYKNKKITYVFDKTISGTAHALWQAKSFLKGRFIVMMGDDIYSRSSILKCSKYDWSIVCKPAQKSDGYNRVVFDKNKKIINFVTPETFYKTNKKNGLIFTGLYSMTDEIFKYKPVKLKTKNEWGLPQTLLKISKNKDIKIIKDSFWISISSPNDIENAKLQLRNKSFL